MKRFDLFFVLSLALATSLTAWAGKKPPPSSKASDDLLANPIGAVCTDHFDYASVQEWVPFNRAWPIYKCSFCGGETKALSVNKRYFCMNCGAAHSGEHLIRPIMRKLPNGDLEVDARFAVTPADEDRAAMKVWKCRSCKSGNRMEDEFCSCGAPLPPPHEIEAIKFEQATQVIPPPPPSSGAANSAASSNWSTGRTVLIGGAAVTIGAGAWWAFSTHDVEGQVSRMKWEHAIEIQRFNPVTREDWKSNITESTPVMPSQGRGESAGAVLRSCENREDPTDQYVCGKDKVWGKTGRQIPTGKLDCPVDLDKSAGTFEKKCTPVMKDEMGWVDVPKMCNRIKKWCSYETYQWQRVNSASTQGENPSSGTSKLPWPEPRLGAHERGVPSESYLLEFEYTHKGNVKTETKRISSEAEFLSWKKGQAVKFKINNIGHISELARQ